MSAIPVIPLNAPPHDGAAPPPTLVCLPGAMCAPQVYAEATALSGLPAIALGWLETDGPHDLDSIATRIGETIAPLPSVILVGHSLGTPLAMLTALQAAHRGSAARICGLVLANSGANTHGHGDIGKLIDRIALGFDAEFRDAFLARCFRTRPAPPLLDALLAYPDRLSPIAVIDALLGQQASDFVPLLSRLPRVPTAIVHGRHDPARTLAHAEQLVDGIAGATLHVLDTGHTSCAEDPAGFAQVLKATARASLQPERG